MNLPNNKWQSMSAIVRRHSIAQPNVSHIFKKLFFKRLITENMLVLFLQYAGLFMTTTTFSPSPIWFASGTACAFVFLRGISILPGIWLGSFLAYYLIHAGITICLAAATLYTLQAFFILYFSLRYITPTLIFYRINKFIYFTFCTSVVIAITTLLLLLLCYSSIHHQATFFKLGLSWWLASVNGVLIFACTLITWDMYFPDIYSLKKIKKIPLIFYYGLLLLFILFLLSTTHMSIMLYLNLCIFILTLGITFIYKWLGAIAALFLFSLLLGIGNFIGMPLFMSLLSSNNQVLLPLFLCLETVIVMLVAIYPANSSVTTAAK